MLQREFAQKIKIHFTFNNLLLEVLPFIRRSWNNYAAGQATDDNIKRHTRLTYWIVKATDTLRIGNTCCLSMATMVTRTRLNVVFIRASRVLFLFSAVVSVPLLLCYPPLFSSALSSASSVSLFILSYSTRHSTPTLQLSKQHRLPKIYPFINTSIHISDRPLKHTVNV